MAPTPHAQPQEHINVKLLLLGDTMVGKTCLERRFFGNGWSSKDVTATIGASFRVRSQFSSPFFSFDGDHDVVGCIGAALALYILGCCGMTILGTQAGGSGTEGQGEHMGAFAVHSAPPLFPFGYFLSARCCVKDWEETNAEMPFALCLVRHCRTLRAWNVSAVC